MQVPLDKTLELMESKLSSKAVKLLSQAVESRMKGYALQIMQTLTLTTSYPAKHRILMRAYKRSKAEANLQDVFETESVASTEASAPSEIAFGITPKKIEGNPAKVIRSAVKVPSLCLRSLSAERNVHYTKVKQDLKGLENKVNSNKTCESPTKKAKPLNYSESSLGLEASCQEIEEEKLPEHSDSYSSALNSVGVKCRTPVRSASRSGKRPSSAHSMRCANTRSKEAVLKRESTVKQLNSDSDSSVRQLFQETWQSENAPKVRGPCQKLPYEADLFKVLNKLTVRKIQEVKDCLHTVPEATEIGLSLLMLFADVDSSIQAICSYRVMKSRRWVQVSNYFSVPGHVISVCRRFIPNVKKGLVSFSKP